MNADNFPDFLRDSTRLYNMNYFELKSLVLQYPYCPNLHQLLLEKSVLEDHPDYEKNLARAAITSIDRRKLRQRILELRSKHEPLDVLDLAQPEDEVLVLKGLDTLEAADPLRKEEARNTYGASPIVPSQVYSPTDPGFETGDEQNDEKSALFQLDFQPVEFSSLEEIGSSLEHTHPGDTFADAQILPEDDPEEEEDMHSFDAEDDEDEDREENGDPSRNSFASWVEQFQPVHIKNKLPQLMETPRSTGSSPKKPAKELNESEQKLHKSAQKSLSFSGDLISEPLASLLARQGQRKKAIAMYEQLMLLFPEKSGFFAAKIEELKEP